MFAAVLFSSREPHHRLSARARASERAGERFDESPISSSSPATQRVSLCHPVRRPANPNQPHSSCPPPPSQNHPINDPTPPLSTISPPATLHHRYLPSPLLNQPPPPPPLPLPPPHHHHHNHPPPPTPTTSTHPSIAYPLHNNNTSLVSFSRPLNHISSHGYYTRSKRKLPPAGRSPELPCQRHWGSPAKQLPGSRRPRPRPARTAAGSVKKSMRWLKSGTPFSAS